MAGPRGLSVADSLQRLLRTIPACTSAISSTSNRRKIQVVGAQNAIALDSSLAGLQWPSPYPEGDAPCLDRCLPSRRRIGSSARQSRPLQPFGYSRQPAAPLRRRPKRGGGLKPLCAVYHQNTLLEVEFALRQGHLRMRNVNTTEDWQLHLTEKERLP